MKKLKTGTVWILVVSLLALGIGLIIWTANSSGNLTNFLIGAVAVDFVALTFLIQVASYKTFRFKPKNQKYPKKEYEHSEELVNDLIRNAGFKERKASYGYSYLKIDGTMAYKIVVVEDNEAYYNPTSDSEEYQSDKRLDKCKNFIAFEIFNNVDEDMIRKLPDYSIQGENVYYTAFGNRENKYVCYNHIAPNDTYKDGYDYLIDVLKFSEVVEKKENE